METAPSHWEFNINQNIFSSIFWPLPLPLANIFSYKYLLPFSLSQAGMLI